MAEPIPPVDWSRFMGTSVFGMGVVEPMPGGSFADAALSAEVAVLAPPDVRVLGREFVAGVTVGFQGIGRWAVSTTVLQRCEQLQVPRIHAEGLLAQMMKIVRRLFVWLLIPRPVDVLPRPSMSAHRFSCSRLEVGAPVNLGPGPKPALRPQRAGLLVYLGEKSLPGVRLLRSQGASYG
jgi:hypothetical protein